LRAGGEGVASESQRQVFRQDAAAVVHDPDEVGAALFDLHVDALAPGVHGVFQEFLNDAGGPLDHFAGGDLGDDRRG
jgi:hypothetical protein